MKFGPETKDRFEKLCHIINGSYADAVAMRGTLVDGPRLDDFRWLVKIRLEESDLPESYRTHFNNLMIVQLWSNGKKNGVPIKYDDLVELFKQHD